MSRCWLPCKIHWGRNTNSAHQFCIFFVCGCNQARWWQCFRCCLDDSWLACEGMSMNSAHRASIFTQECLVRPIVISQRSWIGILVWRCNVCCQWVTEGPHRFTWLLKNTSSDFYSAGTLEDAQAHTWRGCVLLFILCLRTMKWFVEPVIATCYVVRVPVHVSKICRGQTVILGLVWLACESTPGVLAAKLSLNDSDWSLHPHALYSMNTEQLVTTLQW